jgi:hypothetical protein
MHRFLAIRNLPAIPVNLIEFSPNDQNTPKLFPPINRIQAIRVFAVRVTPIFTNKKHALNTLKMALLLRNNVMLP